MQASNQTTQSQDPLSSPSPLQVQCPDKQLRVTKPSNDYCTARTLMCCMIRLNFETSADGAHSSTPMCDGDDNDDDDDGLLAVVMIP